jgi:hypothetical protein
MAEPGTKDLLGANGRPTVHVEMPVRSPQEAYVNVTFDPMYYWTSLQGDCRGFSYGTDPVLCAGGEKVVMVLQNPADSGIGIRNWRTTVSANVNGIFRRVRITDISGGVPIRYTNRGGADNAPLSRAFVGTDATLRYTRDYVIRAEFVPAYRPIEVFVHGSIVIPPGRATAYTFEPVDKDKGAQATVEYVFWEEPWEVSGREGEPPRDDG